jgi:hypothetical protein
METYGHGEGGVWRPAPNTEGASTTAGLRNRIFVARWLGAKPAGRIDLRLFHVLAIFLFLRTSLFWGIFC